MDDLTEFGEVHCLCCGDELDEFQEGDSLLCESCAEQEDDVRLDDDGVSCDSW